ncbi:MAG: argininosuccinate lyase [Candidatus Micrarchaeota archaeon]
MIEFLRGRFGKLPKIIASDYMNKECVVLDSRLIKYDIFGSLAHVKMLAKQNILKKNEENEIIEALKQLLARYQKGEFQLKKELEDVHINIEAEITKLTPYGKKIHTARSRNDQVAVDTRMYLRDELLYIASLIIKLQKSFAKLAKKDVAMPSYTHTRIAQPVTVSFWCESYIQSFERDLERIFDAYKKVNKNPLGACAISGTNWNINRAYTTKLLAFHSLIENEMDAISSRGEIESEILFVLCQLMAKFSRIAEEVILLSEIGIIDIGDEYTTGSSIMPNKKNPDIFEIMRGRTGRVYGNLIHSLTIQKGLMNGHNADTQETKFAVMSGLDVVKETLTLLIDVVPTFEFDEKIAILEIKKGYANATELADLLAMNGISFREVHEKIGKLISQLSKEGRYLEDLKPDEINRILKTKLDVNLILDEKLIQEALLVKKKRFSKHKHKQIKLNPNWEKRINTESNRIKKAFRALLISC